MIRDEVDEVMEMRRLFWKKYYGAISQSQLEAAVKEIMSRQGSLTFTPRFLKAGREFSDKQR